MCERHGKEFVGMVCGQGYCVDCSHEYQESLKFMPNGKPGVIIAYHEGHAIKYTTNPNDPVLRTAMKVWR